MEIFFSSLWMIRCCALPAQTDGPNTEWVAQAHSSRPRGLTGICWSGATSFCPPTHTDLAELDMALRAYLTTECMANLQWIRASSYWRKGSVDAHE